MTTAQAFVKVALLRAAISPFRHFSLPGCSRLLQRATGWYLRAALLEQGAEPKAGMLPCPVSASCAAGAVEIARDCFSWSCGARAVPRSQVGERARQPCKIGERAETRRGEAGA